MMPETTPTAPSPDDQAYPGLDPDNCYVFYDECEFGIQCGSRPRATATRYYADEIGEDFARVTCHVAYMRFLTRQESYERGALERAVVAWFDSHTPPLQWNDARQWVTPDGAVVTAPPELDTVPAGWKPDEDDPVWEFCEKTDPGAVKCWRLGVARRRDPLKGE